MKKVVYLIFCVLLSVWTLHASAQSGKTGNLRWNISNGTLTIFGVGEMPNYKYKQGKGRINSPWYSYLKDISNIVISDGVSSIGNNAFYVCDDVGLTVANIFGSGTSFADNFPNYCGVQSILIPNSIISIGSDAFRNCRNLASIVIPASVTSIGSSAFSDCHSLISISLPNSITTIGSYAFDGCRNMISISIPNSITAIKYCTFRGCHSLVSISIPNSVTTIGGHAFAYCRNIMSITIPKSVSKIDNTAFADCDSLSEIINYAIIPPTIYPFDTFSNINKKKCVLRLPGSLVTSYRISNGWGEFEYIVAIETEKHE